MSSKIALNAPGPAPRPARAWSLAARLTAWYAGSAFALVFAATVFLYWAMARSLDREDDELMAEQVRVVRDVLRDRPGDRTAVRKQVEAARQHAQVYIRIIDQGGNFLAETPGMRKGAPPTAFPPPTSVVGRGAELRADARRPFWGLAVRSEVGQPGQGFFVVQVAMDRTREDELLADYRRNLWLVLGVALIVCASVGYQIARRGIRPIHAIAETARRIRPTNLGERIIPDRLPAELRTLADTFNRMLDRLEQSFARLSRFSADIAHELRTPVNNLRGEVEVALAKPRAAEEYQEVLGSSLEECGRLARLIDSLLFLARAENPRTTIARERFDVGRELATVRDFYEASAAEAGVRLAVAVGGPAVADLDRPLFQRALGNLVANALAHTPPGGSVTLTASGDETGTRVEVADDGCGIPPEHLPHVFDRFYRADDARASAGGGVGLGLAIVRGIAELHGGIVEVASEVGRGTCVVLTFPGPKMAKL